MRKKRVLYLLDHYPQISETYIENEIRGLGDRYELKIISFRHADLEYEDHHDYERIPTNDGERLVRTALEFSPDYLHGHYMTLARLLNQLSRVTKVPFTIRAHSFDVLGKLKGRLPSYADIVNGDACLGVLTFPFTIPSFERAGIRGDKIRGCYPVVDVSRFHDMSPNGDAIMNVGACIPKKNMEDFLVLADAVRTRTFNLYAMGYKQDKLSELNRQMGSPVNMMGTIQPKDMGPEYKKHEWLVYTASRRMANVGWPVAVAEAQASGVGVCMQRARDDLAEYVGDAGYLFDTVDEAKEIISHPFPEDRRRLGFELAWRSDVKQHIGTLEALWNGDPAPPAGRGSVRTAPTP